VNSLRDFEPGDQPRLRALILDGLADRWGGAFDASRNPDLDDIDATYVQRGADVVVVEEDGALVATGTLVAEGDGVGRIVRMSVAGSHRRRGLGRRVVDELVARARARGMRELRVLTDTPWTSAVALYRSCGFRELGDDGVDTHFVMELV
jgi:ribosomal protein S18 acetylase RimI-like enzyme